MTAAVEHNTTSAWVPAVTGVLYAGSLWLSNSSYLYLSVSFIQMTKSLMPGLVYASGCVVGTEQFRPAVALNMALIAFGVLVCALGEVNLVMVGLLEQLAALGFEVCSKIDSKLYSTVPFECTSRNANIEGYVMHLSLHQGSPYTFQPWNSCRVWWWC